MQPQKKFTYWHLIFFNYVLFFYRLLSTISNVSMAGSPATWVLVCFTKYWTETWQFQLPVWLHPAITALKLGSSFIKYKLSSDQVFPNEVFFSYQTASLIDHLLYYILWPKPLVRNEINLTTCFTLVSVDSLQEVKEGRDLSRLCPLLMTLFLQYHGIPLPLATTLHCQQLES